MTAYDKVLAYPVHCLSLIDGDEQQELHLNPVLNSTFEGCERKKLAFVLKAIRCVLGYRDTVAIVGHIGQAPVAWVLQKIGLIRSYILVLYGIEAWRRVVWLDRQAARGAVCIVAITHYTAWEFSQHNGVPPDRMRIIPPALGEEKIELPRGRQEVGRDLAILTVGRLLVTERYKGVDTLIEAVEKARSDGAKVHLTIAGDGDDLPRLKKLASRLGLNRHVAFLGAVSDERLRCLYEECDVFAMPSKGEGFGIVFLEAMRHGKPCIGGNHGGTPEVITHGVDGYLVDYGDVGQLTRYLVTFSQNPALRQQMGCRGYEKVRGKYLFSHMQGGWFSLLDEVLNRKMGCAGPRAS